MEQISTFQRWIMWLCAASFYCFQFILRVSPSVIANDLMDTLMVDACFIGLIVSLYYQGYSLMQVPTGIILDRLGIRGPLSIASLLCSIGCLIFAYGESTTVLSLGRTLMGLGGAFGFLSCVKVASQNFKPQHMALLISLTMVVGTIGGTGGGAPFGKIVSLIGWRDGYKILAMIGIVVAIVTVLSFKNSKTNLHLETVAKARSENLLMAIFDILRNSQTWIYGLYGCMMYVPLSGFTDLWAAPYIEAVYHVDRTTAGGVVSIFYIGLALGATLWSVYVTRVQSYVKAMLWSAILTGVFVTLVIYLPNFNLQTYLALYATYGFMALGGAASAGQFMAFGGISQLHDSHRTATASGVNNMLCMFSGVIAMPLIGFILTKLSPSINGVSHYSGHDYQIALIIIIISVIIAVVSTFFIKENYPVEKSVSNSTPVMSHRAKA